MNMYTVYTVHYALHVRMSASSKLIHYLGRSFQSPNHQEIQCCKWEFCVRFERRFSVT